jgi:hypothetical protein
LEIFAQAHFVLARAFGRAAGEMKAIRCAAGRAHGREQRVEVRARIVRGGCARRGGCQQAAAEQRCGEAHPVAFETIDRYLLGAPVSKADVVAAALAERSDRPAAAPFYRALEAVGVRAADEAFIALRIVLAGHEPSDDRVRRLRALSGVARGAAAGDRAGLKAVAKRNAAVLGDLPIAPDADLAHLREAAERLYRSELAAD